MVDPRELARAALAQTDDELARDCDWEQQPANRDHPAKLRLLHRPTGMRVEVEPRPTEAQSRFIALLYLRNQCYDVLRARGRPRK